MGEGGATHEEDDIEGVQKVVEKGDLTLIGLLGIRDIIRKEVPGAVALCRKAGITVRMVTGDNKVTALAIAKECKIVEEGDNMEMAVMEGKEFYEYVEGLKQNDKGEDEVGNKEKFVQVWKNLKVLARSRPEDKYLMVTGLKQFNETVAVTGDGTNDAPALKKADVGFAMGIAGTDVAKHAADIILLDDNFASIIRAVVWGRNIYDNIRRFLQFQLTVNVVALIVAFIGSAIMKESPLQAIQLLWVNLIMDSLASLALATEPPKDTLLDRPPQSKDEYIVSRKMIKHILGISIYQAIIVFGITLAGEHIIPETCGYVPSNPDKDCFVHPGRLYDWNADPLYLPYRTELGPSRNLTMVFNTFVFLQIFNMINARKINDELNPFADVFANKMFLFIWAIIAVMQILLTQFT